MTTRKHFVSAIVMAQKVMVKSGLPLALLLAVAASARFAAADSVTFVEVDETTNDAWRTSSVAKNDADGDNIYGTDGYFIASYPDGDPLNIVQPSYATIALEPGWIYEATEANQAVFDDVAQTGPGPVPDRVAGDWWNGGGADGNEQAFFTITLNQSANFRLTVIGDQTPNSIPGLLWEASRGIRVTGPTADSGLIDIRGPGESWRDADVDYVLFDISGDAGDVFTVFGENDARWGDNALGGVALDTAIIPEPTAFALAALGLLGLLGFARRRRK